MGRKLYVGNLPYETGEAELQELFARAGTVETVKVMRDMATGRARGFAFVEMSTDEEAGKAITELNAFQLGGRDLTVNEARPKPALVRRIAAAAVATHDAGALNRAGNHRRSNRGGRGPPDSSRSFTVGNEKDTSDGSTVRHWQISVRRPVISPRRTTPSRVRA